MKAKCSSCNTYWNVSIYAQFPKGGYLCPRCRQERKKKEISRMQREEIRMGTKKGAVPSPNGKQHTKKKTRSYYITLEKEIQECSK